MESKQNNIDQINLRSEKVRNIIGRVPPFILRSGIMIITTILIGLFILAYYIPYPEKISGQAILNGNSKSVKILIPYDYVTRISEGMAVNIELKGYAIVSYGYVKGSIQIISKNTIEYNNGIFFLVTVNVTEFHPRIELVENMNGIATIILSDTSVLHYFLNRIVDALSLV
jgi:hypothetical protein